MSRLRVSAVIPTIGRDELFSTVESVLAQTVGLAEVIVAADTADELSLPEDERVRVLRTGPRAGGNVARMAGIRAATGDCIALLDDDDLWDPDKLEHQLAEISWHIDDPLANDRWVSSTLVTEPTGRVWPERRYAGERVPEYLFHKKKVKGGTGAMHTSTLLFPRSLVIAHPFDESLRFHQDIDWLARLDREVPDIQVVQVQEPLTRLRFGGESVSRGITADQSAAWAGHALAHSTAQVQADFLLTVSYFQALRYRDWKAGLRMVRLAFRRGRPSINSLSAVVILPAKIALRGSKI
ncbi:glycosyltransferase [Microbacterium sp. No. 7]|uniref:glycosyltransferase n=1 Tax=Microbacterium sp. No. 7 TaxID=1714373 RepID=UPI0006ED32AF|nr:glycosyltransferase [Microbacterium sp. No. 7]ALJ19052.1 hypothetical protein AOA12_03680 [Microbacterium sp. No. 7]